MSRNHTRRSRRGLYRGRQHELRERELQGRYASAIPSRIEEPVEAHDPEHETGCLRCFEARMGRQERQR